jgi:aryl-alcohol dehydrogenase-like predicted oxidoreductase
MPSQPGKDNGAMSNPIESGAAVEIIRTVGKWQVPALGAGTWALGGRWDFGGTPAGWGDVDDEVSITAIRAAYEGGVRLFDTADAYGCGHAERIVGKAVAPFRDDGGDCDKGRPGLRRSHPHRRGHRYQPRPIFGGPVMRALRRLGTDNIDLYQLHPGEVTAEQAPAVVEVFDQLVAEGKNPQLRDRPTKPWMSSTSSPTGAGCVAVQQQLNVFGANDEALARCETYDLAVLARSPLAMGFLSGKYHSRDQLVAGDVRRETPYWDYFTEAGMPQVAGTIGRDS